ncbi:MAG: hypothetical protein CM1200mP18_22920 [Gammaproteobacteria bacterium]|nr:MAG: hypothetical protein CM1200mP18_22920 [Gammaproteobacteria bacterium]
MKRRQLEFLFLNVGHFFDHLIILIFSAVQPSHWPGSGAWVCTANSLCNPWIRGFWSVCGPAGWLADKWSREGMMLGFFIGIGLLRTHRLCRYTPTNRVRIIFIGMFGAIYHPVGLAMVVEGRVKTGMP